MSIITSVAKICSGFNQNSRNYRFRFPSRLFSKIAPFIAVLFIATATFATPGVVNVNPSGLNGWVIDTAGAATASFQLGPGTPPVGSGSGRFDVGANGDDYSMFRTQAYAGTLLSNLTNLSYSTYSQSGGTGAQAPVFSIRVDLDNDGIADDVLYFEPVYQNGGYGGDPVPNQCGANPNCVTYGQWQTWNALTGGYWPNPVGGPPLTTLANYISAHPGAKIAADGLGSVRIFAGGGAGAWDNYIGYTDNLIIGVSGVDTTYDFELNPPVPDAVEAVYNAVPTTLAPNYASLGFQATQTAQVGDYVHLAGTNRVLNSVTFTMSDWALEATPSNVAYCSAHPGTCSAAGFNHPFTVNIYNIGTGSSGTRQIGSLIATVTQTKLVPWRPVADPTCPGGTAWRAPDTNCYNGYAFNLTFDMSSLGAVLPNDVIVGIAYNTNTWGANPIGESGPFESLNVSVEGSLSTGTDDNDDNIFWNTSTPANYTDGGVAGVGIFREDSNWTPYGTVPIKITATSPTTTNLVVQPSSPIFDENNVTGVAGDFAPGFASGSFASNGIGKTDMQFSPQTFFGRDVTLGEIKSMSYFTKTGATHTVDPRDWYVNIYTKPYAGDVSTPAWYGDRIGTEPYFSSSLSDPANTWNQWNTTPGNNRLRFLRALPVHQVRPSGPIQIRTGIHSSPGTLCPVSLI